MLYSCPYGEPPLSTFIEWRYNRSTAPIAAASYTLAECNRCALLYQVEVGDQDFLEELYTNWIDDPDGPEGYATYRRDIAFPLESRDAHEIVSVASFLDLPFAKMRTLDFGMGWALWAEIARTLGCDSWGTDISSKRREFASNRGIAIADYNDLPEGEFDFINTEQVMEHLVDPYGEAAKLVRALRPGGILKISVPSAEMIKATQLNKAFARKDVAALCSVHPLEHVNGYRKKTLALLANRLGLEIVVPGYLHRFAFLGRAGTVSLKHPKQMAKELVRPFVHWRMPSNLYVWARKLPIDGSRQGTTPWTPKSSK